MSQSRLYHVNTLRPRQNGRRFADDVFTCIFLNENVWNLLKISLKFVRKVPINNIPALVQILAWRRSGDKPLSEPMMVSLLMYICVTRPQWVNKRSHWWFPTNLSEIFHPEHLKLILQTHYISFVNWTLRKKLQWNLNRNSSISFKKMHLKMSSAKWRPFCLGLNVLTHNCESHCPLPALKLTESVTLHYENFSTPTPSNDCAAAIDKYTKQICINSHWNPE